MNGKSQKSKKILAEGRSLPLNFLFSLFFIVFTLTFTNSFLAHHWSLATTVYLIGFILSFFALLLLKGFYLFSYFARIGIAAWLFIVGMYQLNDPIGFSIYLGELQVSESFNSFIQVFPTYIGVVYYAFLSTIYKFGMLFSILTILIGFFLVFKWFYKIAVVSSFFLLLFFLGLCLFHFSNDESLTSVSANINQNTIVSPVIESTSDNLNYVETWTDSNIENNSLLDNSVIDMTTSDELSPCQTTNSDHFFAPLISSKRALVLIVMLVIMSIIAIVTQFVVLENSSQENALLGISLWVATIFFALSTSWYWLISLSALLIYLTLNLKRFSLTIFKNTFAPSIFVGLLLFLYGFYNKTFEPLSDMSCYAVGVNLNDVGTTEDYRIQESFVYYNTDTGAEHVVGLTDHQIIIENPDTHFVFSRVLSFPKNSGYTFDPVLRLQSQVSNEIFNFHFDNFFENYKTQLFEVQYKTNDSVLYFGLNHLPEQYKKNTNVVIQKIRGFDSLLKELYMGKPILEAEKVFIFAVKDFSAITSDEWIKINAMADLLSKDSISAAVLSYATAESWLEQASNNKVNWLYLEVPKNELLQICRSNASLLVLQKGQIKAKYPLRALPKYETIIAKLTAE